MAGKYFLIALINCSAVCVLFLCNGCSDKAVILKTGQPAPAFALTDMKGGTVSVPEDMRGKVVAVRFWSESCKSCAAEMPKIEKIYKKYADKGLIILAVNIGQDKGTVEKFVKEADISYPVLLDPGKKITKRYGVTGVPVTFMLDRNGVIRQKIVGETGSTAFEDIVLSWLKEKNLSRN